MGTKENGHNVHKWAPTQMGTWDYWTFGGKGYPKCPMPISPKCLQMGIGVCRHLGQMNIWRKGCPKCPKGISKVPWAHFPETVVVTRRITICSQMCTGANGHLGKMNICGKGYPKCPNTPAPISFQMLANEQQGKWALGENGHLEEGNTSTFLKEYPKCPMPITPKCVQMGTGANGHLGKEYPNCLVSISPKFFQMDNGKNGHLRSQVPIYLSAHFALVLFWGKWAQDT